MNYSEIVNIIENKRRFGKSTGVEVSSELLEKLNRPEKGQKIIHIAGTNGKGSTAAMISAILREAGFKVGLFTSPHLIRFNERIQIDGIQIGDEDVVRLGAQILSVPMDLELTMFDCCLAMALLYFKEQNCDYIILETGLGGTFDSTNAVIEVPKLSVITNIGFDHTAILGNTLAEIAGNKAGILKKGTNAVIAHMDEEAAIVLERTCREKKIPFRSILDSEGILERYGVNEVGPEGVYQRENAATAASACDMLLHLKTEESEAMLSEKTDIVYIGGKQLSEDRISGAIQEGIKKAHWAGRMEHVRYKGHELILDGAHNPQGVEALAKSLRAMDPEKKYVMIMGVLADKDYGHMLDAILPLCKKLFTVTVNSSRALSNDALAKDVMKRGILAESCDTIEEAVETAGELAGEDTVICFGSLYFIGNLEEKIHGENTGF